MATTSLFETNAETVSEGRVSTAASGLKEHKEDAATVPDDAVDRVLHLGLVCEEGFRGVADGHF